MRYLMVVDDEEEVRETYEQVFMPPKYETMAVSNGRDAARLIKRNKYELIISDYRMPWVNGGDLYSRIRKTKGYETTPIIFVTGYSEDLAPSILSDERVTVIDKPVDIAVLTGVVDELLDEVAKEERDKPKSKIDIELIESYRRVLVSNLAQVTGVDNVEALRPYVYKKNEPVTCDVAEYLYFQSIEASGMICLMYRSDTYLWLMSMLTSTTYRSNEHAISEEGGRLIRMMQKSLWKKIGLLDSDDLNRKFELEVTQGKGFKPRFGSPVIIPLRTAFGEMSAAILARREHY